MKKVLVILSFWTLFCVAFPDMLPAQATPDPALVAGIDAIKVIDNHAHPLRVVKERERDAEWSDLSYHTLETAATDPGGPGVADSLSAATEKPGIHCRLASPLRTSRRPRDEGIAPGGGPGQTKDHA